jgi:hypothetical protein
MRGVRGTYVSHTGQGSCTLNQVRTYDAKYLAVSCPVCGASSGSDCRQKSGAKITRIHSQRAQRFNDRRRDA